MKHLGADLGFAALITAGVAGGLLGVIWMLNRFGQHEEVFLGGALLLLFIVVLWCVRVGRALG